YGNDENGILIRSSSNNTIGGINSIDVNVISANGEAGIRIETNVNGETAHDNKVFGNIIGMAEDGVTEMGNTGAGIFVLTTDGDAGAINNTRIGATFGQDGGNLIS